MTRSLMRRTQQLLLALGSLIAATAGTLQVTTMRTAVVRVDPAFGYPTEGFTAWQVNSQWHQMPAPVRAAGGTGQSIAHVELTNGGAWRVDSGATSVPVTYLAAGGSVGAHPNNVMSYYLACAPNLTAIYSSPDLDYEFFVVGYPAGEGGFARWDALTATGGMPSISSTGMPATPWAVANHSYNTSSSAGTDVARVRTAYWLSANRDVLDIVTCNNGGTILTLPGLKGSWSIWVACLEDSGSGDRAGPTGFGAYTDMPSGRVGPDLTVSGTSFDSYAAPAVAGMVLCVKSYVGGTRTMAQIRTALLATRDPGNKHVRMRDAYDYLLANP